MEKDLNDICNEGYKAASEGVSLKNNPHDQELQNIKYSAWHDGWMEYDSEDPLFLN
jgi:hypothetical protein